MALRTSHFLTRKTVKYNYYSHRYNLEGFTREDVTMQWQDVTYQVIYE